MCDILSISIAVAVATVLCSPGLQTVVVGGNIFTCPAVALFVGGGWILALTARKAYSRFTLGAGVQEWRALLSATYVFLGGLSLVAVILRVRMERGFLAVVLALGLALLIGERWGMRRWLARRRSTGAMLENSLLIGSRDAVVRAAEHIRGLPATGYQPSAVVCTEADAPDTVTLHDGTGLPNLRHWDQLPRLLEETGLRTVIVAEGPRIDRLLMRRLARQLETSNVQLVLTNRFADVVGSVIPWQAVDGLPLMMLDDPQPSRSA